MAVYLQFLREQFFQTPPSPVRKHAGETIIVTGANVGLGLEAARHFTRLDAARVILAVRTVEKGEAAKRSIEESTHRQGVVEVWPLDLSSYESVIQFSKKVDGLDRVDAVLENAGISTSTFKITEEDESTISKRKIVKRDILLADKDQRPMSSVPTFWLYCYCPNYAPRPLDLTSYHGLVS